MKFVGNWNHRTIWILYGLLGLILAYCTYASQFALHNFVLQYGNGVEEPVKMPLLRSGMGNHTYIYQGLLNQRIFSPKQYLVIPDNEITSLKINDQQLDLSVYPQESLRDFSNGVVIDFSEYLHFGDNSIEVTVVDYGGDMGLSIRSQIRIIDQLLYVFWALFFILILNQAWNFKRLSYWHRGIYFLIICGAILRVWVICTYNPVYHIWSDPERHWSQGIDALRIDLMSQTDPLMYQLYIGLLAKITLKIPALVAFYTSCLSLIAPWVWYRFLREMSSNKTVALVGWAILSLLPSWVSIYSYFMQETLLLPLLGAALWMTWRARRKGTVSSYLVMVFIWILAGLTRGIAIPLAAVSCIYLWLYQDEKLKKAVCSIALLLVVLGPLTYRSYQAVGVFAPHGMGHLASLYAMSGKKEILLNTERQGARWTHGFGSPSVGSQPFAPLSDWRSQRTGRFTVDVDFDHGGRDWKAAYERLPRLGENLWIIKENLIFLFYASSWPDNNPARAVDVANIVMKWVWFPLTIIAFVGAVLMWRKHRGNLLLPSILLVWFLIQGILPISVNEGRYRKPFEGLLICQCLLLISIRRGHDRKGILSLDFNESFRSLKASNGN